MCNATSILIGWNKITFSKMVICVQLFCDVIISLLAWPFQMNDVKHKIPHTERDNLRPTVTYRLLYNIVNEAVAWM